MVPICYVFMKTLFTHYSYTYRGFRGEFRFRPPFRMTSTSSTSKYLRGVGGLISDIVYPVHPHGCSAVLGLEVTVSPSKDGPNNCLEWKLCPFYFQEDSLVRERAPSGTSPNLCNWRLRRSADFTSSRTKISPTSYWGMNLEHWWRLRYAGGCRRSSPCRGCLCLA